MKKLLFVIPTLRMGGAEKALTSLLKSLDPSSVQVSLFLFEADGPLRAQIPDWVNILPENKVTRAMTLEFRRYWADLLRERKLCAAAMRLRSSLQPTIEQKIRKKKCFTWGYVKKHIQPIADSYDAAIGFLEGVTDFFVLDKVNAKKKIGWIHTDFSNRRLSAEEIAYYNRFDRLVTITESCRQAFLKATGVPEEKVCVIGNISDPAEIRRMSEEPADLCWDQNVKHLLTVARLEWQKGIDLALLACKQLMEAGANICWHVLGDGSLESWLRQEITAYGLESRFVLEGVAVNPYPYMKKAFAIVQPSRVEGKSIVLDEAKILGKAIITTNYPSVEDQLTNEINGLIVNADADSIAAGVLRLLNDETIAASLMQNARSSSCRDNPIQSFFRLIDTL